MKVELFNDTMKGKEVRGAEEMYVTLTYFVTLLVIVISVFVSLFFKYELERLFREREDVSAFHICNLIIVFMVAIAVYGVMTLYVSGGELHLLLSAPVLFLLILPIYYCGHRAFRNYKITYEKYRTTENDKLIVLNERYLQQKRSVKFRSYNAAAKEDKRMNLKKHRF